MMATVGKHKGMTVSEEIVTLKWGGQYTEYTHHTHLFGQWRTDPPDRDLFVMFASL